MKIILDTNVWFSALLSDSTTRKVILEFDNLFLLPEFVMEEYKEHKKELLDKSELKESDLDDLFQILLKQVELVPSELLLPCRKEALKLVGHIDKNDVIFIACALTFPNSIIWSQDKKLKEVERVIVFNTNEIITFLFGEE